jgi:hypothetical protein
MRDYSGAANGVGAWTESACPHRHRLRSPVECGYLHLTGGYLRVLARAEGFVAFRFFATRFTDSSNSVSSLLSCWISLRALPKGYDGNDKR